jgi:hypothetical protein
LSTSAASASHRCCEYPRAGLDDDERVDDGGGKKRLDGAPARHSIRDLEKGKLRSVRNQA